MRIRARSASQPELMVAALQLDEPFDLNDFLDRLGQRRRRPLVVTDEPGLALMPQDNICGLWVAFPESDQLFIRAGLSPLHREAAVLHEVGHVMLDHGTGDEASTYASLVPNLAASGALTVHRARTQYDVPEEQAAESFARAVLARAGRYIPPPPHAQPTAPHGVATVLDRMAQMYSARP